MYHFQDITCRCKIGQNDQIQEIDLFDIEDIVCDSDVLLTSVSDFEHAQEHPFATACMLQYLTSRQTPSLSLKMEVALSSSTNLAHRVGSRSRFKKEEDVLDPLYRTIRQPTTPTTTKPLSPSSKLARPVKLVSFDVCSFDVCSKEEDVLGSLYRAMMVIYDSSLDSFLRGMCFRYLQLVFEMIGSGIVKKSTREEHFLPSFL